MRRWPVALMPTKLKLCSKRQQLVVAILPLRARILCPRSMSQKNTIALRAVIAFAAIPYWFLLYLYFPLLKKPTFTQVL